MITDRDNDGELLAEPVREDRGEAPTIRLAPGEGAGGRGQTALGIGDKASFGSHRMVKAVMKRG